MDSHKFIDYFTAAYYLNAYVILPWTVTIFSITSLLHPTLMLTSNGHGQSHIYRFLHCPIQHWHSAMDSHTFMDYFTAVSYLNAFGILSWTVTHLWITSLPYLTLMLSAFCHGQSHIYRLFHSVMDSHKFIITSLPHTTLMLAAFCHGQSQISRLLHCRNLP